ncbi:hypothetical protein NEPAR06_1941 [Nematocida parisii]|uniref:Uncharacterized protein n=1 Tax=Nematocida parisii (strain ERTm3) TaxID=935791 RepID=I3EF12_NEMP3|nr:uncharacterized protein NEPG_01987 [Nematocida parisii ERTm1]EIJ87809.1 hypothetical protein NEQG_01881 [Nematocida parisii ERTm3]KAI5129278.1 hypothetical protein NEPAR03_1639 [Nematocida parisii]EIJ93031.1 hypothetical protein NEPG_01987 [Nematocida parisii ERTm1]KAI5129456.1 hypothetical protein NEPAR08_1606 [Nematocida parisii]KAI5142011.1 hypothetical protein NEPAR04_1367 [Nematocida parisii]|eukprot:XP_013059814.1 hypothetical protein NEPG_01987 [Nematocida parisii ERTm1]
MKKYLIRNSTMSHKTEEVATGVESSNSLAQFFLNLFGFVGLLILMCFILILVCFIILLIYAFYDDGWNGVKNCILNIIYPEENMSNKSSDNDNKNANEESSNSTYLIRRTKIDKIPDPIASSSNSSLEESVLQPISNYFVLQPEPNNQSIRPTAPPGSNDIGFVLQIEPNNQSIRPTAPPESNDIGFALPPESIGCSN